MSLPRPVSQPGKGLEVKDSRPYTSAVLKNVPARGSRRHTAVCIMGVRPPVRQHSSPDAVRIRLLMKRHKEPAPATPSTPAPQTRAPGLARPRELCARSPMLPASRRAPGPQSTRPSGVPRAPRFGTRGRARASSHARPRPPLRERARPAPPSLEDAAYLMCLPAAPTRRRPACAARARPVRPPPARLGSPPSAPRAPLTAARSAPSWKLVTSAPPAHP